jgi:hypothetical protein
MADIDTLLTKLSLLARPGMEWGARDGGMALVIHSPREPARVLLSYAFTPKGEAWRGDQATVIQGFAELVETIASLLASTPRSQRSPIGLSGQIFNRAFLLNSHDLASYFNLSLEDLEEDQRLW